MNPFAHNYVPSKSGKAVHTEPPVPERAIEIRFSQDLAADVSVSLSKAIGASVAQSSSTEESAWE
jgi:hypothetical protein